MRRYGLRDDQWDRIKDFLPGREGSVGGTATDNREIEELLSLDPVPRVASCTHGARARPPEDVGGPGGYDNFLQTMADPDHPEHAHTKRWCGGHFDPEWFDLAVTDKDVKNTLKTNIRRRLYQPKPKRHRPS